VLLLLQGYILKCLISPDVQQLATASSDKTVKLWNVDGFSLDRTLTGTGYLFGLGAVAHNQKLFCSSQVSCWVLPPA
jgi:WD40 repeat protein